jgi:hypothetical protein
MRDRWTCLSDQQLLDQCSVDTYRASGPGGQKRNKTSSAVRLRHGPSGLIVIAEESRSQHENKARALRRLRKQLFLKIRQPFPPEDAAAVAFLESLRSRSWKLRPKEADFWPAVGLCLDALMVHEGRLREAAAALGTSTARLVEVLASEPKVWEQANHLRRQFGHKPLKAAD